MAALRPLLLCAAVYLHILTTRAVREPHCAAYGEEETDTTRLQFVTQALVPTITTCDGMHTELWCCTLGYTEIAWQKRLTGSGSWYNISMGNSRHTQEDSQTFVMNYVIKKYDETKYRCTARNESGYEISHTMDLVIRDCVEWDEPPIAIQPAPDLQLLRLPGANITLPCRGVFGPDYETERRPANLTWRRDTLAPDGIVTSSSTWVAGVDNGTEDGRINISFSKGGQTMTSDLHITNVTSEDYGNYTCIMANAVGSVSRVVSLKEGDPNAVNIINITLIDRVSRTVALAFGLSMIITLAVVVVYFVFGLDIRLYYKDRFKRPVDPGKSIDAFVVHAELCAPDQQFVVHQLMPYLEDEHQYKLCIAERDFTPGEPSINTYMSFMERSQCLLVLVSDGLLADDWCRFILNYALQLESRNIVFVLYRKVTTWTDSPEDTMLRRAIKVASHKVTWPATVENGRDACRPLYTVCLYCIGTHPVSDQCSRMGQENVQESPFLVSYIGDRSTGNGNCDGNSSVIDGVHVSNLPSRNDQRVLSNNEINSRPAPRTVDSPSPADVTTCCCYQCYSPPDQHMSEGDNITSTGRRQMDAREARFWKQLRLVLPPRVHWPEGECSESTVAETATLTANII